DRRISRVMEAVGKLRHPRDVIKLAEQRLSNFDQRMKSGWRGYFLCRQNLIENLGTVFGHLSTKAVLGRGYALIQDVSGHVVTSRSQVKKGDKVRIEFYDGAKGAVVQED